MSVRNFKSEDAYLDAVSIEPQPLPCSNSRQLVGDPIDVVSGANTDVTVDFVLHGPVPLIWRRYYNSARNKVLCPLGWGHTHDFDRMLTHDLDGLRYTDPSGRETTFPPLETGERAAKAGLLLCRVAPHRYEILQPNEPAQEFDFGGTDLAAPLCRLRKGDALVRFRYDSNGCLREIVDSLGRSIVVEAGRDRRVLGLFLISATGKDERRELMVYDYDQASNPVAGRDLYGATLRFGWDKNNRMVRRTDRRGYSFHFEYDEQGRCIHSRGDDGLFEVSLDYRPEVKTTAVRRGDGGEWTYFYDGSGTVTQIVDPYGGVTRFMADETGRVTQEIDPKGNVTELLYDDLGRHFARRDPLGYLQPPHEADPNPADPLAYELPQTPLEWEYGRLLAGKNIRRPGFDDPILHDVPPSVLNAFLESDRDDSAAGTNRTANGSESQTQHSTDEQGRPLEHVSAGAVARWKYDPNGNLAEHQDRDGSLYKYEYRSWNALHRQTDPLGHTTVFSHSTQGQVNRLTDPCGTSTEFVYDLKERLVEVRHGSIRERYVYDAAGNIIEKKDGQERTLVSWKIARATLDAVRRLSSGETHSFEYDDRGRIVGAATPDSECTFTFSLDGRCLADKRDGKGVAHEFEVGRLRATTYFEKFRVSYQTAQDGELIVCDPTGAKHLLQVSDAGLIAKHLANKSRELILYDADGRCQRKAVVRDRQHEAAWLRRFSYSRTGDLLSVADTERGTVRYRYDRAHQIAEDTLPDGSRRRFEFDAAGNLFAQPALTAVEMGSGNRLVAANGDHFSYDDRGRLCCREGAAGTTRYVYDSLDMLIACDISGERWKASYDALCRRTAKTWHGCTTSYYWDDFRLAAEIHHDGSLRLYVYVDEVALVPFMFVEYAATDSDPATGKRYYIFTNQIGVPTRVEDDAGKSCWSARIDPYGKAHLTRESMLDMPLRFPGHYCDSETGLHYNRFRYFSAELGRYLQSDPAGVEGGINLYAYPVNPLIDADIDGLKRGGGNSRRSGRKGKGATGKGAGCPIGKKGKGPSKPAAAKKAPKAKRKPREPRTFEKRVVHRDGSITYTFKKKDGSTVNVTYRNGHPDFKPFLYKGPPGKGEVPIKLTPGDRPADFRNANDEAGFMGKRGEATATSHPDGYTWHHHEDGKTMQLLPTDVHDAAPHTGGFSKAKA
jgi:RHS repeat-associated protein